MSSNVSSEESFMLLSLFCRVCKSGTDDQILNGREQNCDYFVDNLFEEAQKVGAMCVPPTTVKNQVSSEEKTSHVCYNSAPGLLWRIDTRSPAVFSSPSVKNYTQNSESCRNSLPSPSQPGLCCWAFGSHCFIVGLESF